MAMPREIRKLAFQTLYQLDARGEEDFERVLEHLEEPETFTASDLRKARELVTGAFQSRGKADATMERLAPEWPPRRQAAVDRAILRLAHFEMWSGRVNPKIVVNEAVELAKAFSTDKAPAFVNGLLDKVLKEVLDAGVASDTSNEPDGDPGQWPSSSPSSHPSNAH